MSQQNIIFTLEQAYAQVKLALSAYPPGIYQDSNLHRLSKISTNLEESIKEAKALQLSQPRQHGSGYQQTLAEWRQGPDSTFIQGGTISSQMIQCPSTQIQADSISLSQTRNTIS